MALLNFKVDTENSSFAAKMFENLKAFFNKSDFDPNFVSDMNMFDYHYPTRISLTINGLYITNRGSWTRHIVPIIGFAYCILGISMMWINIFHTLAEDNVTDFAESLAYVLILNIVFVQILWMVSHTGNYFTIIDILIKDFEDIKTAPQEYRDSFYANQLLIWKLVLLWGVCAIGIGVSFMTKHIAETFYQIFIEEYYEGRLRPYMFQIWLPNDDVFRTPVYEVFTVLQYGMIIVVIALYGTYVSFNVVFLVHPIGQLQLVDLGLKQLFDGDPDKSQLQNRIGEIVRRHNNVYLLCGEIGPAFGLTLLYQIMVTPVELCLTAFQVAEGLENGEIRFLFLLIFSGTLIQLSIPCILGSQLTEMAEKISTTCYFCGWEKYTISKILRNDLQLIIMRANKPLTIDAFGLVPVCMETFSSVLKTAGSYFTMLRQFSEDKSQ